MATTTTMTTQPARHRLLGAAGMIGGLGLLAVEVRELIQTGGAPGAPNIDRIDSIGYLIWGVGMAATMWGLVLLQATGRGRFTRAAPFVAIAGFALMALYSLLDVAGVPRAVIDPVVGAAWVLILLGTLLVGILAPIARVLQGWRRWSPLLCLLTIPMMLLLGPVASLLFGLSWILLGFAVMSSAQPRGMREFELAA